VRRVPSERKRPGSGELPASGSGRPRTRPGGGAMTLLRRATREVYRVYDEEEFFVADAREEHFQAGAPDTGVRWLQRVTGATVLLAVTAAVGGVVAVAGTRPARGGRRAGASLLAATGAVVSARARVWRAPVRSGASRRQSSPGRRARDVPRAGALATAAAGPRAEARPRVASGSRLASASPRPHPAQAEAAVMPASVAQPVAVSASAGVQAPGHPEFGFER